MSDLRDFLQLHVDFVRKQMKVPDWEYAGPMDLVLREGTEYTPAPYDAGRWGPKGVVKECFKNAYDLACAFPDELTYVEGYADKTLPAIHHAWCVTEDGVVVDPTWDEPGDAYLGIPFGVRFVSETILRRELYGVIDDWQNDFPLCRAPFDREAVLI